MTTDATKANEAATRRWATAVLMFFLLSIPFATASYKIFVLDYQLEDVLPDTQYNVTVEMSLDGNATRARARTFLPQDDGHQVILDVIPTSGSTFRFSDDSEDGNRVGSWFGSSVPDGTRFSYRFTARVIGQRYEIAPDIEVPESYPPSLAEDLQPEEAIQVDAPEIVEKLTQIGANEGSVLTRLQAIYDATRALTPRPFSGTTDALTALRLGEASCNGKSRLFVALSRAAGIPARLVGGLILEQGRKRTSHQWVEVYIGGNWIPFDPLNEHFAYVPGNYLVLYRGDYGLFRYTSDVNFDYEFVIDADQAPPLRTLETFSTFNVWGLFDRLGLPFSLLRTVLMLPIGALLVVVFRNVVGVPTFGTFLPALIAEGASETGLWWGLVSICIVMLTVALARLAIQRFGLLHSPTLAILLAVVVVTMLGTSLIAEALGLMPMTRISYFPIAVMAIASERFYLALVESGPRKAFSHLGGTLLVVFSCYLVMNSMAMQVLVSGFPEVLLWVIAGNVYLGRWVGVRVLEMLRFKGLIIPPTVAAAPTQAGPAVVAAAGVAPEASSSGEPADGAEPKDDAAGSGAPDERFTAPSGDASTPDAAPEGGSAGDGQTGVPRGPQAERAEEP